MFISSSGVTQLLDDMTTPIENRICENNAQISFGQTNSPISRNSKLNTPKIQKRFSTQLGSITPCSVLLYGQPLYESCMGRERVASGPRQGRKNTPRCSETTAPAKISRFRCHAKHRFLRPKLSIFGRHGTGPCSPKDLPLQIRFAI